MKAFPKRTSVRTVLAVLVLAIAGALTAAEAPDAATAAKLKDFDAWMNQTLKDWNVPGIGVGIVVGDRLVFAKGYGYRDYGAKLPFTPNTLYQIASNSKLFTAVAAGLLVEEGKLTWDKPVRESVPSIHFYNDYLDQTITLRDMLSHRTGITRHDSIWYMAPDSRKELFTKLRFMEPKEAPRTVYLYNNMMYAAAGYLVELQSGKTWEDFVRERIFKPLEMNNTLYSIADMARQPDHFVGYTEKRDSFEIYKVPYYEDTAGMAPAGAIISNIEDMSHWLVALMNDGKYKGKQVIPASVLKATLQPSISLPNTLPELRGWWEILNTSYCMGRSITSYRGHLLTSHGGDLDGIHSQVSFLPHEKVGVLVAVIGNHAAPLYNLVSYNVYERLLGMDQTPWIQRNLEIRLKGKKAATEARGKAGLDQVRDTKPSHALADYVGEYEHPAYGLLKIGMKDGALQYDFHKMAFPMTHYHYDRFDTPDDEHYGKSSVNFLTNPQGDVDRAVMSLDEAEATFVRRAEKLDPAIVKQLPGTYETPTGAKFQVSLKEDGSLFLVFVGQPERKLIPYKGLKFRIPEFSDVVWEFAMEGGQVKSLKQRDPSGEVTFARK
jgi:CubicO group peptidase (beta-lactamase class C family)